MALRSGTCRECGKEFSARQHSAMFCSDPCRAAFNRRRHDRGTELYDVLMSNNFDKSNAAPEHVVDGLLRAYRDADNKARAGRPSWQSWQYSQMRLPLAYSDEGDKR